MWRESSVVANFDIWMFDLMIYIPTKPAEWQDPTLTLWSTTILMASPYDLHAFLYHSVSLGLSSLCYCFYLFFSSWTSSSSSCFLAFLFFFSLYPFSFVLFFSSSFWFCCFFHGSSLFILLLLSLWSKTRETIKKTKGKEERKEGKKGRQKRGRKTEQQRKEQNMFGFVGFKPTIKLFGSNSIVVCFVCVPPTLSCFSVRLLCFIFFFSFFFFLLLSSFFPLPLLHFHPLLRWCEAEEARERRKTNKGKNQKQ